MAFSATYIEITLRYIFLGQNCQTARIYSWDGASIAAASAAQVGEAWWNHYKDAWRAIPVNSLSEVRFTTVIVREVGGSLSYGEYAIPVEEQSGDRSSGEGGYLPSYAAVGCRLTVGSTVTRPGQLRIPFLLEGDVTLNDVEADFLTLCEPLATLYSQANIMGAPIATGVLQPSVVTYGADNNTVDAGQDVIGFALNPYVTSQVSRRRGHGS